MKKLNLKMIMAAMVALALAACTGGTPLDDSTELWPAGDGSNHKIGYIDKAGNMVIQPQFMNASTFSCGYAVVYASGYKFINKKGEFQGESYDNADDFYYNYSRVSELRKWGLINTKFKQTLESNYTYLGNQTKDGLILMSTSGNKYGYIDAKGNVVIAEQYERAQDFVDGIAAISVGDKWGCINTDGLSVIPPTYDFLQPIGNDRVVYYMNGKYGLLDTKGVVRVQPEYEYIGVGYLWMDGWLPVCKDGKWGYINANGDVKVELKYSSANPFRDGYAVVEQSDLSVVIGTDGNIRYMMDKGEFPVSMFFHNGLLLTGVYKLGEDYEYRYRDYAGHIVYSWKEEMVYDSPASNPAFFNAGELSEPRPLKSVDNFWLRVK